MTAPDPADRLDRGLVLRAVAGAAVIGLVVALLSAGLWLSVTSRDRGPSAPPTGVAVVSPTPIASAGGTASPGSSGGSPSAGESGSPPGASGSPGGPPGSGSSPASSATPAPTLAPVTTVGSSAVVSAPTSPFAACRLGGPGSISANSEVEPTIATDPTRPGTIVAAWQQDRWSNGAARGIVAATSGDAGRTWARNEPAFAACAPGGAGLPTRVSDPWLSFGPDGTGYLTGLSVTQPNETSVTVSRTRDGGRTWSAPKAVAKSETAAQFNDKESVTADPTRPGRAYVVWDQTGGGENEGNGQPGRRGSVLLATTTDAGGTWSAARSIASLAGTPVGNVLAVLPDGTLVDVFVLAPASQQGNASEVAIRSTDAGATWSAPITIASLAGRDVIGSQPPGVRGGGGLPDIAVDARSGTIHAVWTDRPSGAPSILVSSSTDGGRTWSSPTVVPRGGSGPVFLPSVALTAAGSVGIEYTDLRAATSTQRFLADRFLTVSTDGGSTWHERRLTQTFDLATAPNAGGRFVGDYFGLATAGELFVSSFAITTGRANDPTSLVVRSDPVDDPAAVVIR